jgi:large subunit ribosomal protein L9
MEVILTQDIDNLGSKDDIVAVKPGFARNFLIPQGMAVHASVSAKKVMAENVRQRAHKETKLLDEAQAIASKMEAIKLSIGAKAGENGKIFGSVNNIQIAEALAKLGFDFERKNISIPDEAIKQLGEYEATVKIHKEVSQQVKFEVVSE